MTAYPIWFGREESPLFGWIHLPEQAVAGVALCSPIGIEGSPGYRGLAVLAKRLEAAGIVVLRFDYTGTGDSACNTDDVSSVETWVEDIEFGIELVRGTGVRRIGLVGLRIGALLAAHVAPSVSVDSLVLWDPCLTGRRFIREQEILGSVVSGETRIAATGPSDVVDIPSIQLPRGLADTLANIDLEVETGKLPGHVLVLSRPDRKVPLAIRERLSVVHTDWIEAPEQYMFFESHTLYMPDRTIGKIAEWCIANLGSSSEFSVVPQSPSLIWSSAVVVGKAETSVVERPITVNETGLFGILTEPLAVPTLVKDSGTAPAVLMLNLAGDRHTGPSRLWVDLGRKWAQPRHANASA